VALSLIESATLGVLKLAVPGYQVCQYCPSKVPLLVRILKKDVKKSGLFEPQNEEIVLQLPETQRITHNRARFACLSPSKSLLENFSMAMLKRDRRFPPFQQTNVFFFLKNIYLSLLDH